MAFNTEAIKPRTYVSDQHTIYLPLLGSTYLCERTRYGLEVELDEVIGPSVESPLRAPDHGADQLHPSGHYDYIS